jgi:hypothetical protein
LLRGHNLKTNADRRDQKGKTWSCKAPVKATDGEQQVLPEIDPGATLLPTVKFTLADWEDNPQLFWSTQARDLRRSELHSDLQMLLNDDDRKTKKITLAQAGSLIDIAILPVPVASQFREVPQVLAMLSSSLQPPLVAHRVP